MKLETPKTSTRIFIDSLTCEWVLSLFYTIKRLKWQSWYLNISARKLILIYYKQKLMSLFTMCDNISIWNTHINQRKNVQLKSFYIFFVFFVCYEEFVTDVSRKTNNIDIILIIDFDIFHDISLISTINVL